MNKAIDWNAPFCAEDFRTVYEKSEIAEIANARFRELLEEAQTVYGFKNDDKFVNQCSVRTSVDTHQAKLIAIEEIKK